MRPSAHLSIAVDRSGTQQRPSLPFALRFAMAVVLIVLVTLVLLAADISAGLQLNSEPLIPMTDFFGE